MGSGSKRFLDLETLFMKHLRLYHHPVGIFFEEKGKNRIVPELVPKNKLSFCQLLAFVREVGESVRLEANRLGCITAADVFGFKNEREKAIKTLKNYLSPSEAESFYEVRPRFALGEIESVVLAPLGKCSEEPDAVVMVLDGLQAMHLLDFYAKAEDMSEIPLSHNVTGAACANAVKALKKNGPQLALPCPGAFTSGKMERGEMILAFPWKAFLKVGKVMEEKAEKGRVSLLGGEELVGNDVCRNCPLIKFEKVAEGEKCGQEAHT